MRTNIKLCDVLSCAIIAHVICFSSFLLLLSVVRRLQMRHYKSLLLIRYTLFYIKKTCVSSFQRYIFQLLLSFFFLIMSNFRGKKNKKHNLRYLLHYFFSSINGPNSIRTYSNKVAHIWKNTNLSTMLALFYSLLFWVRILLKKEKKNTISIRKKDAPKKENITITKKEETKQVKKQCYRVDSTGWGLITSSRKTQWEKFKRRRK